jgi:hypothetical protein
MKVQRKCHHCHMCPTVHWSEFLYKFVTFQGVWNRNITEDAEFSCSFKLCLCTAVLLHLHSRMLWIHSWCFVVASDKLRIPVVWDTRKTPESLATAKTLECAGRKLWSRQICRTTNLCQTKVEIVTSAGSNLLINQDASVMTDFC